MTPRRHHRAYLALALLSIALLAAAMIAQAKLPGAGYTPMPGARVLAGTAHGLPSVPLNTACDPWAGGGFDRELMFCRYGLHWQSGAPGPHSDVFAGQLHERCHDGTGRWSTPAQLALYDCAPHPREVTDAYYTQDPRVKPLVVRPTPTPQPSPSPSPTATPQPTPDPCSCWCNGDREQSLRAALIESREVLAAVPGQGVRRITWRLAVEVARALQAVDEALDTLPTCGCSTDRLCNVLVEEGGLQP